MTYYIKQGRRYIPVGHDGPNLYDGIWLVKSSPSRHSATNIEKLLCELPDKRDLDILAKSVQLEDDICEVMLRAWENKNAMSIADVARKIALMLAKKEKKIRDKKREKTKNKKLTVRNIR